LKKLVNSEVDTPDGKATLSEIYVTELGFIMAKIYYPKTKSWINHKIGELDNLLKDFGVSAKSGLMRKIKVDFKKELV
jgi:hypothetical protein